MLTGNIEKLHIPIHCGLCDDPAVQLGKHAACRELRSDQWRHRRHHLDDRLRHYRSYVYDLLHGRDGFNGPYSWRTVPLGLGIRASVGSKATQLHRRYVFH